MKKFIDRADAFLNNYLYYDGDSQETMVKKKLWWLFNLGGLPFLIVLSLMIADTMGTVVLAVNVVFALSMIVPLVMFHFDKQHIERYNLFMQITILVLTTIKVYLMGGLLEAGTPIFIGLTSPLYALATGNRRRAVALYMIYIAAMVITTEMQESTIHNYHLFYSYIGFGLGITIAFVGLYYYTGQLENLKRKEKSRMEELDRLKTNFFTHITHELRTPLTIILGMADRVREDPEQNLEKGLEMISRNGRKLLNMTNQLLDLSKMEAMLMPVNWVQGDITGYLRYIAESFQSYAESRSIELLTSMKDSELLMDFDPEKIREIMSNLISNAIKFTPEGGRVTISAFEEGLNGKRELVLQVRDNGPGIAGEHLPKIFERYFQAQRHVDEFTEGSGLGLAITRELVHLLNGDVSVSSELNRGTIFTVRLPITNQAEMTDAFGFSESLPHRKSTGDRIEERTPLVDGEGKLKLLIVEDSADVTAYLKSLLDSEYSLLSASNGEEGWQLAVEEVPDLVISDVMMPRMDGFTLCRRLKDDIRTSHIPIILLTARNEKAARMEGLRCGADAYLGKPFNKEELFIRTDRLIALRRSLKDSFERMMSGPDTGSRPLAGGLEYAFLNRTRASIESHLSEEDFGISELAGELGMSRSQLYRKFAALTDKSVNQFIRSLRLSKARELLRTTDLNVAEVAYDTGFKNPSHFSRAYRLEFGIPPSREQENSILTRRVTTLER